MNILDLQNDSCVLDDYINGIENRVNKCTQDDLKMSLKGHLLKSLEHQWKQPLNYISTNLLNLEICAEFNRLNLEKVNEFNQNIEEAIQTTSDNISFYNKLFVTSTTKNKFFLHSIAKNYFNIVQHKIRNNDIEFKYEAFLNDETAINNYENETTLEIILLLLIISDILIEQNLNNISLTIESNTQDTYAFVEFKINTEIQPSLLFKSHILYWNVIKNSLELTNGKIYHQSFNEQTIITLQLDY